MSNYFNPFQDFENNEIVKKEETIISEIKKDIVVSKEKSNNQKIIIESSDNKSKPKDFDKNAASKYFNSSYNTNNLKPNIISLINSNNLSDKNKYTIIKHLYSQIQDEEYKEKIHRLTKNKI